MLLQDGLNIIMLMYSKVVLFFSTETWHDFLADTLLFSLIAPFTLWPFIFNRYLIPRLEEQIGERFEYRFPEYNTRIPQYMAHQYEIISYIVAKYIAWKIFKVPSERALYFTDTSVLQRHHYRVEEAPRYLIVISFIALISHLWFFIAGALFYYHIV